MVNPAARASQEHHAATSLPALLAAARSAAGWDRTGDHPSLDEARRYHDALDWAERYASRGDFCAAWEELDNAYFNAEAAEIDVAPVQLALREAERLMAAAWTARAS